jgi:maltooligosyltrehalose trehalohydrolase
VILDVVYNHLGPSGNVLPRFSTHYETDKYANEWGVAINFDGPQSAGTRDLVLANVEYWVREFHVDGFRIDAAQQIYDDSEEHILRALCLRARATAAPRRVIVTAEHEPQHADLLRRPDQGGLGLDAVYNEDFHHCLKVTLTGMRDASLSDYTGESREWLALVRRGFLFQGQHYPWQKQVRGRPALDVSAPQLIAFLENHDQVANSLTGHRLIDMTSPAWWRAMSAFLLLGPWTPFVFQGQEQASRRPFHFFADHDPALQTAVETGRHDFLSQFGRVRTATADTRSGSIGRQAFEASQLTEPDHDSTAWQLYRDLLALRREDGTLGQRAAAIDGIPLGERTLLLRFFGNHQGDDRLMVVNLAPDMNLGALSDPLVAPPLEQQWSVLWCSEHLRYGGHGIPASTPPTSLMATGHATTIFRPEIAR